MPEIEDTVVYKDGTWLRILHGIIIFEDANWVILKRRDGEHKIAMSTVTRISRAAKPEGGE